MKLTLLDPLGAGLDDLRRPHRLPGDLMSKPAPLP